MSNGLLYPELKHDTHTHFKGMKEIPIFRGAQEFVEFLGPRNMLGKFVMGETPNGSITIVGRNVPCLGKRW